MAFAIRGSKEYLVICKKMKNKINKSVIKKSKKCEEKSGPLFGPHSSFVSKIEQKKKKKKYETKKIETSKSGFG